MIFIVGAAFFIQSCIPQKLLGQTLIGLRSSNLPSHLLVYAYNLKSSIISIILDNKKPPFITAFSTVIKESL